MATTRSFQDMLNEYLSYDLMKEELIKRDWLLSNMEIEDGWKGGTIPVPFEGAQASSLKYGGLTADSDIAEYDYVRGQITSMPEVWGTLKFNHRDLMEHDGKVSEKSFLKILPGQIDNFMQHMKECVSEDLLNGPKVAVVTDATNAATGVMIVDRIEKFILGQKWVLIDNDTAQVEVYVTAINLNTSEVTLSLTRGGAAANLAAYTVAQSARFYRDGVLVGGTAFASLRDGLLSAANGGSASLYGQSKLAFPYLQAINVSGASVTSSNILGKLFDAYNEVRKKARGNANKIVMSYRNMGWVMAAIETQKGAFKVSPVTSKASLYGWTEIELTSVKGNLTLIAVQELRDDVIMFLDMSAFKFITNGFFKKRTAPDGKQYYEVRGTSGYSYLLDMCLFGEFVLHAPTKCGILHSIP
jgi:hypothetical protein